jgi:glyoxylase-like metal-dependent hydrolase (beta-lactamase superfamily II)
MKTSRHSGIIHIAEIVTAILTLAIGQPAISQQFDSDLIERTRAASRMVPGDLPFEVRFQGYNYWSWPLSYAVEGAPSDMFPGNHGVFQIRFSNGWIMVDAGADKEIVWEKGDTFSDEEFALVGAALRGASLIVATHEHHDHIGGVVRGPWAADASRRAMLTTEQLEALMTRPNHPSIRISQEHADQFLSVSYDELLPIAPGVVLIKAAGHTPGSQMVYVKLESGTEMLFVGDVVWMAAALDSGSQKPVSISSEVGEDRDALAEQIKWLQELRRTGLAIVVAHDARAIDELIENGLIKDGAYTGKSN